MVTICEFEQLVDHRDMKANKVGKLVDYAHHLVVEGN